MSRSRTVTRFVPADELLSKAPLQSDLPEDWKRRYALHRQLGRIEYGRHLQREENNRRRVVAAPGPSRADRYKFTHPGLGGP